MHTLSDYRRTSKSRSGSYGRVTQVVRLADGEKLALKELHGGGSSPTPAIRMKREVEVLQQLRHPNIVELLDWAEDFSWYVMPWSSGVLVNLRNEVKTDEDRVALVRQLLEGLKPAHAARHIHRDIKPRNILRFQGDGGDRWVLADWGTVRQPHGDTTRQLTRQDGHALGTEGWAAPELDAAESAHRADGRSDLYSVGCVAAWLETGQVPRMNVSPAVPSTSHLFPFVRKCCAQVAAGRPSDVDAALELLQMVGEQDSEVGGLAALISDVQAGAVTGPDLVDELGDMDLGPLATELVGLPASEQELLFTELVSKLGDLGYEGRRKGISTAVRILGVLSRKQGDLALFRRCIGGLFDVEPALDQWSLNDTLDLFVTLDEKRAALVATELRGNTVALRWYQTLAERYYDLEKIKLPLRKLLR